MQCCGIDLIRFPPPTWRASGECCAGTSRRPLFNHGIIESFTAQSTAAPQEHALTLKQIVLALPPELRDVFLLTHIQGLSYREVAVLRNIPERTVKDRMRRALERTSAAMRD